MTKCIVNMYFTVIPNKPPLLEKQDGASNFDYIFQNILNPMDSNNINLRLPGTNQINTDYYSFSVKSQHSQRFFNL